MKIVFLSRWFPYPPSNGSKLRIYNLLRGLSQKHEITLLTFADQPEQPLEPGPLQTICREIKVVPWKGFQPDSQNARLGFFSLTPRSVIDTFSPEMQQHIEQTLAADNYNLVIASQFDMAVYSQYFKNVPALFEEIEVGVLYERFAQAPSLPHRFRHGLTWFKHRRYLARLLKNFRLGTVVSEQERRILARTIPEAGPIEVIPNCIDLGSYAEIQVAPQPNSLIFTGAFNYYPNYEAMQWFLGQVYPRIQAAIPEARLSITGDHGDRPLPPATNVTRTGFVDDIRPLIAGAWASIVPLHTGGGTRLKIIEAMALRTPVVATSKGAEGLEAQPGHHLLVADTATEFAQAVVQLLQSPHLRQQLAANAYQLVSQKYDWAVMMPHFLTKIEQIAQTSPYLYPPEIRDTP